MLKFPSESDAVENLVDGVGELVAVSTGNEADDGSIPEQGTGGVDSGDDVDGANKKDTFDRARERREVKRTGVIFLPATT